MKWGRVAASYSILPIFKPGVRIILRDGDGARDGVPLAAIVTKHHTCGYAGGTQNKRDSARIMLTEAFLSIEPERIHLITTNAQWWRR